MDTLFDAYIILFVVCAIASIISIIGLFAIKNSALKTLMFFAVVALSVALCVLNVTSIGGSIPEYICAIALFAIPVIAILAKFKKLKTIADILVIIGLIAPIIDMFFII